MKKLATTMLLSVACLSGSWAQSTWIDLTDTYVVNPRFDNNDRTTGWLGTVLGAANPMENAEHFSKNYDTYQQITGLKPGKYRVSLNAFYRMGSARNDYQLYSAGNYESYQHAKLYATSNQGSYTTAILPASSAAISQALGGGTSTVGGSEGGRPGDWGNESALYIPNNMEAADYWFNAGYYVNTLECEVGSDGKLTIGIKKNETIGSDWTCIDNWKLEYYGEVSEASKENIVINEIMAANTDVYMDPSCNYGTWVELYNPTDQNIQLGGLYVSDDAESLKKNKLVDDYGILPAHGYALLNFGHHEVWTKYAYRQIDDELDYEGGTIILSDGTNIIAQQNYPQAIARTSYARLTDGGEEWGTTGNPSPGKQNQTNGGFAATRLEAPNVDKDAQLFTGTLQVKVNIPAGATLKYTTDGTTPTLSNGSVSETGYFSIDKTTCYRFRLFEDGYLPSEVVTRSYILDGGNYHFPIISVVTDPKNIYSTEYGVFESGSHGTPGNGSSTKRNWNMDWDRPVAFDYISKNNENLISQECNFAMCGGWSRGFTPHSFKLKANKSYEGNSYFKAQVFEQKPHLKNKVLQIRNGGNDTSCRIKDAATQQVVAKSGLYVDYQEWQPVHVFLNGEHYAVLNMREPNNKHYAYANYGLDTDQMDQFEMSPDSGYVQKEGTAEAFERLVSLSKNAQDEETYKEICNLLDIDEYQNYMAVEFFVGGTDWPQNNVKGFRDTNNGKFHFVIFDLDFAGNTSAPFTNFFNKQNYTFDKLYGYDYSLGKSIEGTRRQAEIKFVTLFKNLLNNDTFRKKFIDTYCIVGGSVFQPKYVKQIVNAMADTMSLGGYINPTESANVLLNKFGADTYDRSMVNQLKNCTYMQITSTKQQVSIASNLSTAKIEYNGIELPYTEFNGYLFGPVVLTAKAPAGYKFAGWSTTGEATGEYASTASQYTLPETGSVQLTAIFEKDENTAAKDITPVRVNEISADNSMSLNDYYKKADWVELYNTTDEAIDIAGIYISDNLKKPKKYQVPTDDENLNTVIPAHGYKVIWFDKQSNIGSDIHASFKLDAEGGSVYITTKEYADTLNYDAHTGIQSYGRYPDGAANTCLMNIPTIGKSNKLSSYDTLFGQADSDSSTNSIKECLVAKGLTMVYTGDVVNIKSETSAIKQVSLYTVSGQQMNPSLQNNKGDHFCTLYVGNLPQGVYIVKVSTENGASRTMKVSIK